MTTTISTAISTFKGTLAIVGRGMDVTVIDADYDRIAEVLPGAVATLSKLTVRNGNGWIRGGGLDVNAGGTLNLKYCGVSSNRSAAGSNPVGTGDFQVGIGGGIWNGGTLNIDASRIDDNFSTGGGGNIGFGGGIYNVGSLTVRDARFIGNRALAKDDTGHGGAIYNAGTADIPARLSKATGFDSSAKGPPFLMSARCGLRTARSPATPTALH